MHHTRLPASHADMSMPCLLLRSCAVNADCADGMVLLADATGRPWAALSFIRVCLPQRRPSVPSALVATLRPSVADPAFCVQPAELDATLHLLGAAAQQGTAQPLRIPASIDGVTALSLRAHDSEIHPIALLLGMLPGDAMQATHRMLGGPSLELGLLVAKAASRQLPAVTQVSSDASCVSWTSILSCCLKHEAQAQTASNNKRSCVCLMCQCNDKSSVLANALDMQAQGEAEDWQVMYDACWQAADTAHSMAASMPSAAATVNVSLLGSGSPLRLLSKHSAKGSASAHSASAAPGKLSDGRGLAIRALAGSHSVPSRLLSAGLHLTQQACSAAAASIGLMSSGSGTVQPSGAAARTAGVAASTAGAAGLAAMLKVAAAEHPGTSFLAASAGLAVPAVQLDLPQVCHAALH